MNKFLFSNQIQSILTDFLVVKSRSQYSDLSDMDDEIVSELITKSKAAVARISGLNSEYYKDIVSVLQKNHLLPGTKLMNIAGSLKALKDDLDNGYLKSLSELIHADVFSDYLEMAKYLLDEGYHNPAAVVAGTTLESHLKELCKKRDIKIEILNQKGKIVSKKADLMNSDLAKVECYPSTYQKQITAWLDLRNSAAHGKYENYTVEEVRLMISGLRNFLLTYTS